MAIGICSSSLRSGALELLKRAVPLQALGKQHASLWTKAILRKAEFAQAAGSLGVRDELLHADQVATSCNLRSSEWPSTNV